MLNIYCRSNLVFRAENCFKNIFKKYNLKADVYSYKALLRMYNSMLHVNECLGILNRMKQNHLEITSEIYHLVLHCCRKAHKIEEGLQVLYQMNMQQIIPNESLKQYFNQSVVQNRARTPNQKNFRKKKKLINGLIKKFQP